MKKRIAKATRESLPFCPWDTIWANYPELLTQKGMESGIDREHYYQERAKVATLDLWSVVPKREPNERPITQKQIDFLRSLGVEDEALIGTLGIRQASAVIEHVLENKSS